MRIRTLTAAVIGYLALTSCTVAAPWTDAQLSKGWIGIETVKGGTTFMLACRIPTKDGPAETYESRIKTAKAPGATDMLRISRPRDVLAVTMVWPGMQDGYYVSPMNEDEAHRVFAAIRQSGGITIKADGWVDIEVGVADGDVARLDGFMDKCKGKG